jgi:hypothetical protein
MSGRTPDVRLEVSNESLVDDLQRVRLLADAVDAPGNRSEVMETRKRSDMATALCMVMPNAEHHARPEAKRKDVA